MKRLFMKAGYVLFLLTLLLSCTRDEPELREVKATITGFHIAMAACMGGYMIDVDSRLYRINSFPSDAPYQNPDKVNFPAKVWIRYRSATKGMCANFSYAIDIISIRRR